MTLPAAIEITRPVFDPPALSRTGAAIASTLSITRSDLREPPGDPRTLAIDIRPGALTLLTGPSGSGKSTILRVLESEALERGVRVITAPSARLPDRPACDLISDDADGAMRALARAGLGDVRAMVRPASCLSEGQRARLRLAIALGHAERASRGSAPVLVILDEFCSTLDALTARGVAALVHRAVRSAPRFACIVASPRDDLVPHLAPTHAIHLGDPVRPGVRLRATPEPVRLRISNGTRADYLRLAHLHYRPGPPATIERILRARDRDSGVLAGVVVVSRPVVCAAWRELAWPARFGGPPTRALARRVNRELRCVSRVIVDPRFRALGVAHRLVRAYLRDPATRLTEAVAAMGHASPGSGFFAGAGMTPYRIAPRPADARFADALAHIGIDAWRAADPDTLAARILDSPHRDFIAREARTWASASRSTERWRDAPIALAIARAARALAPTPIAFAHTAA